MANYMLCQPETDYGDREKRKVTQVVKLTKK